MARYFERTRDVKRARLLAEAILYASLIAFFARLLRLLISRVRANRLGDIDQIITDWEYEFDEDYGGAIVLAAGKLADAESKWWGGNGKDVTIDGATVAGNFDTSTRINAGAGRNPAYMIAENIRDGVKAEIAAWQAKPDATPADLNRRLRVWLDEARARTISRTDTTNLQSEVTRIGMTQAGVGFWVWQTLYGTGNVDDSVCDRCLPLNGRVFAIADQMPPLHHNDRCLPVPLKQYLKQHDQPYQRTAERLAHG